MTILGIESSCDETSAAVLHDGRLLSNVISSQHFHSEFGGVVPELASRAHLQSIVPIIRSAMDTANVGFEDLDAVAATQGPGLIGSLLVGLNAGKAIAFSHGVPFLPVHHIEAHLFSSFIEDAHPEFPFLGLVVSGGHTMLIKVHDVGTYDLLGSTIDDAAGEAFDKVAKMLGLGFPGGPAVDRLAMEGNPSAVSFPRPLLTSGDLRFSFSGIKTAVLYHVRDVFKDRGAHHFLDGELEDICASFQQAVVDTLVEKTMAAALTHGLNDITVVGGVSANTALQRQLETRAADHGFRVFIPALELSTDNAGMVAKLASLKWDRGFRGSLHAPAFARIGDSLFNA